MLRGLVAGRWHGTTAGQPVTISGGAGEGGALAQPASSVRQRLISPIAEFIVFTFEYLNGALTIRQALAQLVLLVPQFALCIAFVFQGVGEGVGCLQVAVCVITGGLCRILSPFGFAFSDVDACFLNPYQQHQGAKPSATATG